MKETDPVLYYSKEGLDVGAALKHFFNLDLMCIYSLN